MYEREGEERERREREKRERHVNEMAGTCSIDIVRIHHWPPCESFAGSQKENSPLAAGSPFFFISLPLDGWDLSLDGWDGAREKGGGSKYPYPLSRSGQG